MLPWTRLYEPFQCQFRLFRQYAIPSNRNAAGHSQVPISYKTPISKRADCDRSVWCDFVNVMLVKCTKSRWWIMFNVSLSRKHLSRAHIPISKSWIAIHCVRSASCVQLVQTEWHAMCVARVSRADYPTLCTSIISIWDITTKLWIKIIIIS